MVLPHNLQHLIDKLTQSQNTKELKSSSLHLSEQYREGHSLSRKEDLLTYLTVRFPATYAAITHVFDQIPFEIASLLDLGAGPGTGWWAARAKWGEITATCIEKERTFIALGQKLGCSAYQHDDLEKLTHFAPHDLALLSYSYGELNAFNFAPLWEAVKCVVLIEPGTPRGFHNMLRARDALIALGGHVLAPCPHSTQCPHTWCHFAVRIPRSEGHRLAKSASLPYEDEKFSYVIVTKEPLNQGIPRIVATPRKHTGHVELELCTIEGLEKRIVSKRMKEVYKRTRKFRWGDLTD